MIDYNTLSYPHSQHRRYVRGCEACLQRTKAGQARLTESRRRIRAANEAARARFYAQAAHLPSCLSHMMAGVCTCGMP